MVQSSAVRTDPEAPPLLLRVIYFLLFGWWFTGVWINIAWIFNLTLIGLPVGLWMIDRVPQILTLSPMSGVMQTVVQDGRVIVVGMEGIPQLSWLVRLIYFVFVGWWFSLLWSNAAWVISATIIGLPVGIWMFHRLPGVTTLMRR